MSSVADQLAREAGINTVFPGKSEYIEHYVPTSKLELKQAQQAHSINKNLVKMHKLREEKYSKASENLKITGETETRFRHIRHENSAYIKRRLARSEIESSSTKNSPFKGTTEYIERYNTINERTKQQDSSTPDFEVNPKMNLLSASNGRPYDNGIIRSEDLKTFGKTQYQNTYQWPDKNQIDKFPWMK